MRAVKKGAFKRGTKLRAARGEVAEALKREGMDTGRAFAIATASAKKMRPANVERLAQRKRRGR
jgi:hypothetical protein